MRKLKFKIPKITVVIGLSNYQKGKIKKALMLKTDELSSIEYTLCSGFKKIDLQIEEIRKSEINEENIRAVLSKDLKRLIEYQNTLELEVEILKRYISDDGKKELTKLERKEIKKEIKKL